MFLVSFNLFKRARHNTLLIHIKKSLSQQTLEEASKATCCPLLTAGKTQTAKGQMRWIPVFSTQKLSWVLASGWKLFNRLHKVNHFTCVVQASAQQGSKDTTHTLTREPATNLHHTAKGMKPLLSFQVVSLQSHLFFFFHVLHFHYALK